MKNTDVLVDLQFGSTGKGLLAGYIGVKNGYDAVVSCNMPNAGHTAYSPGGEKFMHKVLPSAIFGKELSVIGVGPGAVFDIDRLELEWAAVCKYRPDLMLVIHEAAGILLPEHRAAEQATLSRISSTMQGSAEAMIAKIRRQEGATAKCRQVAIEHRLGVSGKAVVVTQNDWLAIFSNAESILLEGSQGYSLGLSSGFYPYCTSRDCTPARVISDCSMPVGWLRDVYGSCRVHPIRVGNTQDGFSGGWYPDQTELTFKQLGVEDELTTVTGRVRRVASFSEMQISEAMAMALPKHIFLNFCNYDDQEANRVKAVIADLAVCHECGDVTMMGFGPLSSDIKEV